MGAGVCVLASDIPENREAIGDAGFVFKRGDRLDLQRMLAFLLSDDTLRTSSGIRGKQRVRENYLWDDVTERIERVYRDLNGGGAVETASVTRVAAEKVA